MNREIERWYKSERASERAAYRSQEQSVKSVWHRYQELQAKSTWTKEECEEFVALREQITLTN